MGRRRKTDVKVRKPKLEDFYDVNDPRGCSSSEYDELVKALNDWKNKKS